MFLEGESLTLNHTLFKVDDSFQHHRKILFKVALSSMEQ